ncbi:MAG: citrate lyase subunit alpha [Desulfovibrio sp.]|jgi:citrate lyase subunit alpha/citrate CoA-transferase|nr:citrate lyase subunit alpha [Desulfovibrio sp.]
MSVNSLGRELPETIGGHKLVPYAGPFALTPPDSCVSSKRKLALLRPGESKMKASIKDAILACGLRDGMTISFHHSFREGDMIIGQVLTVIRELGIKGLRFAPSAVINIRNPSIVDFVKDGVIDRIEASGIRGQLGDAVVDGLMDNPVILRPHGARPRAIESGALDIDVAFIGASSADEYGNATGLIGPNACGSLGYSFIDAKSAGKVVIITDCLVDYPCVPTSISQQDVDYVVVVEQIGDSEKIGKGAARVTKNPRDLLIADWAAQLAAYSGFFENGYSFQTGAGAISIACTNYLANLTAERGIRASFALGGLTAAIVEMFQRGLIRTIQCSQCFDAVAARSLTTDPNIVEIDNSVYANIFNKGSMVNKLTFGILGALEVDTDFNVNILTGSSGEMMGGLGGGPDVAAGAEVSIVTLPIVRGRTPSVVKRVFTLCTPGETVAAVVTEAGIALNPKHRNYGILKENLEKSRLKLVDIEYLQKVAENLLGVPKPIECTDKIVTLVEYRDGSIIDVIRQVKRL